MLRTSQFRDSAQESTSLATEGSLWRQLRAAQETIRCLQQELFDKSQDYCTQAVETFYFIAKNEIFAQEVERLSRRSQFRDPAMQDSAQESTPSATAGFFGSQEACRQAEETCYLVAKNKFFAQEIERLVDAMSELEEMLNSKIKEVESIQGLPNLFYLKPTTVASRPTPH